jgi:phage N-6-adenine-methyltransferase
MPGNDDSKKTNAVRALTITGKDDWRTPPAVLLALDAEFDFWFDAASTGAAAVGEIHAGPGSRFWPDGLAPWPDADGRAAWLNPPYSRAAGRGRGIYAWHERAWLESRNGWTVVVLCPPHPGRKWMQEFGRKADEVRVYKRRLAFIDPATGEAVKGNTQDSCLVVYRPHVPEGGWSGGPRWSWIDVPA